MEKGKIVKFVLFIILVLAFLFISWQYDLRAYFQAEKIRDTVESFGVLAPLMYIIIYVIGTIFFVPGTIFTISGGILFGFLEGAIYTLIAANLSANLAFNLSRHLARGFTEEIISKRVQRVHRYEKRLKEKGFTTVLFLRLIPFFPFNALNLSLGLTKVRLKDYFLATSIGIIPGTFVYSYFGDSIAKLSRINILIAVMLIILLGLIILLYRLYKRPSQKE